MSHGTEHHLEEAEHAKHHALDPFTSRVAMTMAIIAAALAFVSLLSHRKHNEVIQEQINATTKFTEASNKWSQYQAKRIRSYMFESDAELLAALSAAPSDGGAAACEKQIKKWRDKIQTYEKGDPNWEEKRKQREKAEKEAAEGDGPARDPDSLPNLQHKAEELTEQSDHLRHEAAHAHHQANYLDSGHLGLEMGLVLSSVAVLTKRRSFWYGGVLVAAVGFMVSMIAFLPFAGH